MGRSLIPPHHVQVFQVNPALWFSSDTWQLKFRCIFCSIPDSIQKSASLTPSWLSVAVQRWQLVKYGGSDGPQSHYRRANDAFVPATGSPARLFALRTVRCESRSVINCKKHLNKQTNKRVNKCYWRDLCPVWRTAALTVVMIVAVDCNSMLSDALSFTCSRLK